MTERYSRRHMIKLALFAPALLAACKGVGAKGGSLTSEESFIVVTPTEVPPTNVPEPTQVPTPEEPVLSFGRYDVFMGNLDGGGRVVFTTLPDSEGAGTGAIVFASDRRMDTCGNGSYKFNFIIKSTYKDNTANIKRFSKSAVVNLIAQDTVSGEVAEDGTLASCTPGKVNFTGRKFGVGKAAFLASFRQALASSGVTYTDAQAQNSIETQSGFKLPEN